MNVRSLPNSCAPFARPWIARSVRDGCGVYCGPRCASPMRGASFCRALFAPRCRCSVSSDLVTTSAAIAAGLSPWNLWGVAADAQRRAQVTPSAPAGLSTLALPPPDLRTWWSRRRRPPVVLGKARPQPGHFCIRRAGSHREQRTESRSSRPPASDRFLFWRGLAFLAAGGRPPLA